jgi:uncharacterized protein (TIRG00374 family)
VSVPGERAEVGLGPEAAPSWRDRLTTPAVRLGLGLTLGVLAGFLALRGTDLEEMWGLLSHVVLWPVALSLVLVALTQLAKTLRWQLILTDDGKGVPLALALRGILVGQAVNLLVPIRAGDFARAYLVGRHLDVGSVYTYYTVVVEKALDALMLLVCLAALLFWGPWPDWLSRSGILVSVLTVVGVAGALGGAWLWQRSGYRRNWEGSQPTSWFARRFLMPVAELGASLTAASRDGRLLWMGIWSAVVWGLGVATNWAIFASLGLRVHWTAALLILVAVYAGAIVPAPPARVGLFHFLVVLALSAYGVERSEAVACAVLLHLVVIVPLLIAGGIATCIEA